LITTNLDNDDGLSSDFVDRLQRVPLKHARTAVYFTYGLVRSGSSLYLRPDRNNAFCSVSETWEAPVTCWTAWHNLLSETMPVQEIPGAAAWLQVVHGSNVSNRVRGRRVSPETFRELFPTVLIGVVDPTRVVLSLDWLLAQPLRFSRELARTVAKAVAIRLFGREGIDRAKLLLARAVRFERTQVAKK